MKKKDRPICSACKVRINVNNLLVDFPIYTRKRKCHSVENKDLNQIIENEEGYDEMFKFLRDINIYDNI